MSLHDSTLIALTGLAIGALVLLVTRWKINAFIALLVASLIVGGGAVLLGHGKVQLTPAQPVPFTLIDVLKSFQEGLGGTLGGIAAVLGLGAMLGRLLAESGGAEVLARRFTEMFGLGRIGWGVLALGLAVGLATWFAVGLILLTPIVLTLARQTQRPFLLLALPLVAALSVTHGLMPPHPGPVVAVAALGGDMGLVLLWGAVVGLPTILIAGPVLARWLHPRVPVETPAAKAGGENPLRPANPPGFALTLGTILLPVILMLAATVAELVLPAASPLRDALRIAGHSTLALLVSVGFALWSFGFRCGYPAGQLARFLEHSVAGVGMTLLVVGGGGGFARVLRDAGVADAIGHAGQWLHLPPLLYGWLLAVFVRVATGSATVAITTAAGLLAPVLALQPGLTPHHVALVIVALGCGSLFLSHLNDGGFWIVKDCLGLTVGQTLRTWTVCETVIGVLGMLLALLCFQLV